MKNGRWFGKKEPGGGNDGNWPGGGGGAAGGGVGSPRTSSRGAPAGELSGMRWAFEGLGGGLAAPPGRAGSPSSAPHYITSPHYM